MRLVENFGAADKIHKRIPAFLVETTRKISKKNKPPGAQQRRGGLTGSRASVRIFHDGVSQKAIEVRVCIRRQLLRGTHDDKPVPRIPWVIWGMHVRVWIFRKTAALIEALSAQAERIHRRVYFKD